MRLIESIIKKLNESAEEELGSIKSSKGGFYIGDPCYVLPDSIYHDIWGDKYDYEDGIITTPDGDWIVHGTAYGDGYFNNHYGVDSGTLSVIPANLIDKKKSSRVNNLGKLFPGKEAKAYWSDDGVFTVEIDGNIVEEIDTDPKDEDYDYDEEYDESAKLKEAIEPKYEKSNEDYNSFLRDVKHYTGSYDYLYGGKVNAEVKGTPIRIDYFYYNRPYVGGGYNLVVNVLTPLDFEGEWVSPYDVQEAIDNAFERNSQKLLSNKEIKSKILDVVSSLN